MEKLKEDTINHPPWYTKGKIEVLDFILDQGLDWCSSNAIKYISRAPYKGKEINDLQKAIWYLQKRVKQLEAK